MRIFSVIILSRLSACSALTIDGGIIMKLNQSELQQLDILVDGIRSDKPHNPRPARDYVNLVRGRVCVYLIEKIKANQIRDIYVVHTKYGDLYAHK